MASYRPFPPQSSFATPPTQNPLSPQPQQQQQQQRPNQYNQNYPQIAPPQPPHAAAPFPQSYSQLSSNYHYPPSRPQHQQPPLLPPPPQYAYAAPPPPPPPDSSYPPPPPSPPAKLPQNSLQQRQPPMYYSQYGNHPAQTLQPPPPPPPPPPSSPPPSSSIPPPPPPSSPPPPPPKEIGLDRGSNVRDKGREHGNMNHGVGSKLLQKPQVPVPPTAKKSNGLAGRMETEEERRLRKKREYEKQRQEERVRQQFKESQNTVLQKTQTMSLGKGHGSVMGSRMGDRRTTSFLSGERIENRLKKPTTFLCKLK